jgi:hypothetical protein
MGQIAATVKRGRLWHGADCSPVANTYRVAITKALAWGRIAVQWKIQIGLQSHRVGQKPMYTVYVHYVWKEITK